MKGKGKGGRGTAGKCHYLTQREAPGGRTHGEKKSVCLGGQNKRGHIETIGNTHLSVCQKKGKRNAGHRVKKVDRLGKETHCTKKSPRKEVRGEDIAGKLDLEHFPATRRSK